jgi:hypothetical protein
MISIAFYRTATLVLLAFIPIVAIKLQPEHVPYSVFAIAVGFIVVVALAMQNSRMNDNDA